MKTLEFLSMRFEGNEKRDFRPSFFRGLTSLENRLVLEKNFGAKLGYGEQDYLDTNGKISFGDRDEVLAADVVVSVRTPGFDDLEKLRPGAVFFSMLHYLTRTRRNEFLTQRQIRLVSMDSVVDDFGIRLIHDFPGSVENAFDAGYQEIFRNRCPELLRVLILGSGEIGKLATDTAILKSKVPTIVSVVGVSVTKNAKVMDELLAGTITTPAGYGVAELPPAALGRQRSAAVQPLSPGCRNNLNFAISAGAASVYALTFMPEAVVAYDGIVAINSNDADHPLVTIPVSGSGCILNSPPTISLPAGFAFDRNGCLAVDFSVYIADADGDPLSLACGGNSDINVDIDGLSVTFTAAQNWTGTEFITFSVFDGFAYAYDTVEVTVNPVTGPGWVPVQYPNATATVFGLVSIYGLPASLNDAVGAFVGEECRGLADVVLETGDAYAAITVNLATNSETVSFKLFDYSTSTIYGADQAYVLSFGQRVGSLEAPVPISVSLVSSQVIQLSGGWNMLSSYLIPTISDIQAVFGQLITDGYLAKAQNDAGNTLETDLYGVWQNGIGDFLPTEGYLVKVNQDCALSISGLTTELPLTCHISSGWNIIPYPYSQSCNAEALLTQLGLTGDAGPMIKIQNDNGAAITRDIHGNWIYGFTEFVPGEAYYIKVTSPISIIYPIAPACARKR